MRRGLLLVCLVLSAPAGALDLEGFKTKLNDLTKPSDSSRPAGSGLAQFSTQEQVESLRQALAQGADTAVSNLVAGDEHVPARFDGNAAGPVRHLTG